MKNDNMVKSIYSIYKATNIHNGLCYIGFDSKWPKRQKEHLIESYLENRTASNQIFHQAIREYGWDSFEWEIIYQSYDSRHCLKKMESHFIKSYNSKIPNGYNMTDGGNGCLGFKHSEETKQKLSKIHKGKILTAAHKDKIGTANLGKKKPGTSEYRKQWFKTEEGLQEKEKLRKRLSDTPIKRKVKVTLVCTVCNNSYETYPSRATTSKSCSRECYNIFRKSNLSQRIAFT